MKFYLYEEQSDGCDYTIGCGKRLRPIEGASSMEDAVRIACATDPPEGEPLECGALIVTAGERAVRRAVVLAVAFEHEINLAGLARGRKEQQRLLDEAQREQFERALLERLKGKYGG